MTVIDAVDARCSRRKYAGTPIDSDAAGELQKLITQCVEKENLNIQLVLDNGDAFKGFRRSYGLFSDVTNYIGLISNKNVENCNERLGYYGELIVLHATILGLGTCWVGGSFDRSETPFMLSPSESVSCVIAVGNVSDEMSFREKLVHGITHRKTKPAEKMFTAGGEVPDWFMSGMRAVQKAPSAVNRQPVMFTYTAGSGAVTASVPKPEDAGMAIDLGIAKLHFKIGAGAGVWDFGNHGAFVRDKGQRAD